MDSTVRASRRDRPSKQRNLHYECIGVLGNGSFGTVYEARCRETGEKVAVKRVLQDQRYKNRELNIIKELKHPNVVIFKDYFYSQDAASKTDVYLNVVMDYVPETAHNVVKNHIRKNQRMIPMILTKLYVYQICRAMGYLHALGICHRDIKPQNLLVDPTLHILKLCDFGSAKRLHPDEGSVAYICSRFYRAPELMLGATHYTPAIDTWSIGCVMGELLIGRPLFAGQTSVDQLVRVIQVLGTPTADQMSAMNPSYQEFKFTSVVPKEWRKVVGADVPEEAISLLAEFLKYEPAKRIRPLDALAHPFFDELRKPDTKLPSGSALPPLFDFLKEELDNMDVIVRQKVQPTTTAVDCLATAQSPSSSSMSS